MHISPLDIAVIAIYLLAVLGVGLYQALKIRTSGDYYAGGRKFNKFYLMMHALGTASHADEPVSVIGGAFEKGLSGIWYTYLFLPLTPIFWLLAAYIRRTRFITVADFFRVRYASNSLATLYSFMGVFSLSVGIGVGLKGVGQIFGSITNGQINQLWAMLAMTVVFVTYGFAGGLRATVITETIQGPLIVVMSLLLVPFGLHAIGGFSGLHASLKPEMFSLRALSGDEFTRVWILAMSASALIGWVAQPGVVASVGSGKSELEGRVGYTYGTMIKRFCAMGWVCTGIMLAAVVAQNKLAPEEAARLTQNRELAFGTAMRALLPHGLLGLMFAAILASQMATLSAHMVNSSALASRNIYKNLLRPEATDREVLVVGRIIGIFLVAIGVTLAALLPSVANALTALIQTATLMGTIVWTGVLWRRANSYGAWAAFAVMTPIWLTLGPIGMILHKLAPHTMPHWFGIYGTPQQVPALLISYFPLGVLAIIVVSLLTPPQPREQVNGFFMLLKTPVGQEQKLLDAGVPVIYGGSSTPNWLETNHPNLVQWGGFLLAALICVLVLAILVLLARIGA